MSLLRIIISGFILLTGPDVTKKEGTEMMALLVESSHGSPKSKVSLVHRPFFEFSCDELDWPGPLPCEVAFERSPRVGDNGVNHRFSLEAGYDIEVLYAKRNSLERLVGEAIDCENCVKKTKLRDIEKLVQINDILSEPRKMRKEFFLPELDEHAREHVWARLFMTEGVLGSIPDVQDKEWKFKTSIFKVVHSERLAMQAGWELPFADKVIKIQFKPQDPNGGIKPFVLSFEPGDDGVVDIVISNEPDLDDYCSLTTKQALSHFGESFDFLEDFNEKRPYPRSSFDVSQACELYAKESEDGGGRYPVICLKSEIPGYELP